MVLRSAGYGLDLFLRKPLPQMLVVADDAGRYFMMMLASFCKPRIVICGGDVCYLDISSEPFGQSGGPTYNMQCVVALVCAVEVVVSGYDVRLDILLQRFAYFHIVGLCGCGLPCERRRKGNDNL